MAAPRSTIALLPFQTDAEASASESLRNALAAEIAAELTRFSALEVVHPQSSFAAASQLASPSEVGAELSADFLVGGRVSRSGDTVRVSADLIEVRGGRQVWADRFEAGAREIPVLEEHIASQIAAALAIEIDATRLRRSRRREVSDLEAYELWIRGSERLRGGTLEDDLAARILFERARELDPEFARAHVGLSLSYFNDWSCQAWQRWDENEAHAFVHARAAVAIDDRDSIAHMVLGRIELYRRNFKAARRHLDLAQELSPNDAELLIQLSLARALLGEGPEARALAEKAMRLHPRHPDWYFGLAALACLSTREFEQGIELARKAWNATVDLPALVAAGSAELGDLDAAAAHLQVFDRGFREKVLFGRSPEPGEALRWILHVNPFERSEDADFLAAALLRAGLEGDPQAERRAVADTSAGRPSARFAPAGSQWKLRFQGEDVTLNTLKGFRDISRLLGQPGSPIHSIELAEHVAPAVDGEPVLDARARAEYEERIRDLQAELERAEAHNDLGASERAQRELDVVVDTLARGLGLGGRSRRMGSAAERARTAVTWRIRSAIKRIQDAHPPLGRHLANSLRTGAFCVYQPEAPVDWEL